jgi:hypothetical protein
VQEEVRKVNKTEGGSKVGGGEVRRGAGVLIMSGVAKKKVDLKKKGELIEQNQDGLEVNQ